MILPAHHFCHVLMPAWAASNADNLQWPQCEIPAMLTQRSFPFPPPFLLGAGVGQKGSLLSQVKGGTQKVSPSFQLIGKHHSIWLASEESSLLQGCSKAWEEVDHSKWSIQGRAVSLCQGWKPVPCRRRSWAGTLPELSTQGKGGGNRSCLFSMENSDRKRKK